MSHLSPKSIAEFQALWKKHYGEELPPEDAVQRAHQVFDLVHLLLTSPAAQQAGEIMKK